jgi:hypothetical protein
MITTAFQNEVAEFVDTRITKVVLNGGEYEITDFTIKTVSGNVVVLNYIVPNGSVATVIQIELKNNSGTVSDNTVNIPIASATLMVQTITVKEG